MYSHKAEEAHMNSVKLLIIDPQNDFMDLSGAALPVAGAMQDIQRTANFLSKASGHIEELIITLDSHPFVAIERTSFWQTLEGKEVAPFTQITESDVRGGRFIPRNTSLLPQVLSYLQQLEARKTYQLMVWPVHCVIGTWGHNIPEILNEQIALWEQSRQRPSYKVLKGLNPLTEAYSAVRAEVPDPKDVNTMTNHKLIGRARPGKEGITFVAGEASSHCVSSTVGHLLQEWTREERANLVVLRDCMSPVTGFESQAEQCFELVRDCGGRVMTSHEALQLFA